LNGEKLRIRFLVSGPKFLLQGSGFKGSRVQGFKGSRVQRFKGSKVRGFKGSRVRGFKVPGSRFKVQGSRFKVPGSRFRVQGSRFKVQGSRFRVQGSRFRVHNKYRSFAADILLCTAKGNSLKQQVVGRGVRKGKRAFALAGRTSIIQNSKEKPLSVPFTWY
jgi:hypothetical protein